LATLKASSSWHFPSIDKDNHFKENVLKRKFKYIKNGQMTGNTEIASMLIEDLDCLLEKTVIQYPFGRNIHFNLHL
jgi:hypothetical protein